MNAARNSAALRAAVCDGCRICETRAAALATRYELGAQPDEPPAEVAQWRKLEALVVALEAVRAALKATARDVLPRAFTADLLNAQETLEALTEQYEKALDELRGYRRAKQDRPRFARQYAEADPQSQRSMEL